MQVIHKTAYARAGLIGNPSDGYGGKTIAFTIRDYCAEIALHEWATVEIITGSNDQNQYESVLSLRQKISQHGYYGGTRLVKATIKQFVDYCVNQNLELHSRNFAIHYTSNIPQQVGMAGSSAIIIATLRALMDFYNIPIDRLIQPTLALDVERRELGIAGGLQDRVVQVYEGLIAMDFGITNHKYGFEYSLYEALDCKLLPNIYVAYQPSGSEPTEVFHNDLRYRYDAGDKSVVAAMSRFAELTDIAKRAISERDHQSLHHAINANFDLRDSICNLNPVHTEMVRVARTCGASAKYAGSGGAIVGTYIEPAQYGLLQERLTALGCTVFKPTIA